MASFGCHVDTFERDPNLVEIAKENIKNYGYEKSDKSHRT
jgi:protein-L-isoaspartate O-methyltransferase